MARVTHKISPINLRALPYQKHLIDLAASVSNRSRSDFMLEAACNAAENVLLNQRLFFIDEEAYNEFVSLLESPVKDNLEFKALLKSRAPWEE